MKTEKTWTDHKGETVPAKYIDAYTKSKEKTIIKIVEQAEKLSAQLLNFKTGAFMLCDNLNDNLFENNNTERKAGTKGNYTLFSFDKSIKVEVNVQDIIDFDDRIQVAQAKINEFLELKTKGADQDLSLLVNNAFKTTKGRLDKSRVLGLFSLKIKHQLWDEAMDLIKQSITTNSTRRYISISRRQEDGRYKLINLNISSI